MSTTDPITQPKPPGVVGRVAMRVSDIERIDVVQSRARVASRPASGMELVAAQSEPRLTARRDGESRIVVTGEFVFRGLTQDAGASPTESLHEGNVFIEIDATLEIEYSLDDGPPFSDEDASAFAMLNGLLNLQPFWREFVFSTLGRSGVPGFILPVFNPVKMAEARKAAAAAKAAAAPKPLTPAP